MQPYFYASVCQSSKVGCNIIYKLLPSQANDTHFLVFSLPHCGFISIEDKGK